MTRLLCLVWLAPLLLGGCNPDAGLWVRVEAPFLVPEQADALHLIVQRRSGELAFEQTYALDADHPFPQTLSLVDPQGAAVEQGEVEVRASALRDGALPEPWAHAQASVVLKPGELQEVVLRICDCGAKP